MAKAPENIVMPINFRMGTDQVITHIVRPYSIVCFLFGMTIYAIAHIEI